MWAQNPRATVNATLWREHRLLPFGTRARPFNKQASTSKHRTATSRPYITQRPSSSPLEEFSRRQGPRGWPSLATSRRPDTVVGCAGVWLSGHSAGRWGLGRRPNPPGRGTHYLLLLADRRALSLQAWAACGTSGRVTRHGQSWPRLWRSFLKGFGRFGGMVGRRPGMEGRILCRLAMHAQAGTRPHPSSFDAR